MSYAVFCVRKNHNRALDPPCMDPLDFGIGSEPDHHLLLRRGRVGLFDTEEEAISAMQATIKAAPSGSKWLKTFSFMVVKCMARGVELELADDAEQEKSQPESVA